MEKYLVGVKEGLEMKTANQIYMNIVMFHQNQEKPLQIDSVWTPQVGWMNLQTPNELTEERIQSFIAGGMITQISVNQCPYRIANSARYFDTRRMVSRIEGFSIYVEPIQPSPGKVAYTIENPSGVCIFDSGDAYGTLSDMKRCIALRTHLTYQEVSDEIDRNISRLYAEDEGYFVYFVAERGNLQSCENPHMPENLDHMGYRDVARMFHNEEDFDRILFVNYVNKNVHDWKDNRINDAARLEFFGETYNWNEEDTEDDDK